MREKLYRGNRITRGSAKYPNLPCITWDQSIADKRGWVLRCIVKHLEEIKKSRWGVMVPLKKPATRYTDPWSIPLELLRHTILENASLDVVWNRPGISCAGIVGNQPSAYWSFRLPGGPQISVREFIRRGTRGPRQQAASDKRQAPSIKLDSRENVGYSFVIALGTVALFKTSTVHNKEGERHE